MTSLVLTGCWDREEVNDLALITAAGIDKNSDNKIKLSVQVFIPKQSGGGMQEMGGSDGGKTLVRSAEGITLADAMAKLQERIPRRIFWGHDEVFIFGEKLAKEGIRDHVDFLMRHPEIRARAYMFVSKKEAKDILGLLPPLERSSSEVLREMARAKIGLDVTLIELDQMLSSEVEAAAMPWVEVLPPEASGQNEKKSTIPYITGTAVFKKDKMIGHIDSQATRGVLWLRNEIRSAVATVKPKGADGFISMVLLRANTTLDPTIADGQWKITLKGETEDDVVQNSTTLKIMNPDISRMLENELRAKIDHHVRAALDQVQKKMNADILGFADAFHRKYPDEWSRVKDRWEEIYPNIEVQVAVKPAVRRPGGVTAPAGLPEKEVKHK